MKRRFFLKTLAGTGALACLGAGCSNHVLAAPLARLTVGSDGTVRVDLTRYPDLEPIGGALALDLQLPADSGFVAARGGILVVHRAADSDAAPYLVTQAQCPHKGCPLGYSVADGLIECPCHGSKFRAAADPLAPGSCAGDVLHLPARQALTVYEVVYQADQQMLIVHLPATLCAPALPAADAGQVVLSFADFPSLMAPGGFVVGQPSGVDDTLIVVRVDAATVIATSAVCTHLGCKVAWSAPAVRFECPCHGSAYGVDGAVENGPATQPLRSYSAALDGEAVIVQIS